jgi:hypothetical protein
MGTVVADTGRDLGYTVQQEGKTYRAVSGGVTRIDKLNEGLQGYHADLMGDPLAAQRVEVSVITFGDTVQTVSPFVIAHEFVPPALTAAGETLMGGYTSKTGSITTGPGFSSSLMANRQTIGKLPRRKFARAKRTSNSPSSPWVWKEPISVF